ncbi:DUF1775 domain-containing protein [Agrobacterium salinitolerans]|uniref:DUF1775 domain-containing protein n=1 Tax=Agrobacterium salinitolerans TaxID=1183413 RepID=A0A4Z1R4R3_9HYPH|nr:copper chaperone PCu(A)C [Agrobacterium salinitolerans]QXC51794.1 DUF1775 domain-containing protein [Agrobacterium salinitolerans]UYZ08487.1 DUF1775 domain-containing protein [Agrobacterium salinitolerans]
MKTTKIITCSLFVASVSTAQAFAHATFVDGSAEQESTIVAALQVPHGCDGGLATTEVQIKLPEGFISAKPQPKAGWELEIIKGDYQKTYKNHGKEIKSGPVEIRWKGGNLPDEFYDTFAVQGKISGVEVGQDLPFKVTQLCGDKGKVSWDEVAAAGVDPHSLKSPAPTIKVTAKSEHAGGHDHSAMAMDMAMDMDVVKAGNLEVSDGATKAMLPGQPVGGGYVTIKNTGDSDDKLVGVESSSAGRAEIHEMAMVNDVMKMRKLDEGIVIPAGQTVELKPGGLHMMFFDVKKPFAEGDKVPVTLIFEKAGKVEIVLSTGAAKGGGDHQHN